MSDAFTRYFQGVPATTRSKLPVYDSTMFVPEQVRRLVSDEWFWSGFVNRQGTSNQSYATLYVCVCLGRLCFVQSLMLAAAHQLFLLSRSSLAFNLVFCLCVRGKQVGVRKIKALPVKRTMSKSLKYNCSRLAVHKTQSSSLILG